RLAFNVLVQRGLDVLCGDCAEHAQCTLSGQHRFGAGAALARRGRRQPAWKGRRIFLRARGTTRVRRRGRPQPG
ncbi:MAG TPA: hypothetical protein VG710_12150, partial [Opitutus sp.]|nr:hypothetical protein [Opitutus sp.]